MQGPASIGETDGIERNCVYQRDKNIFKFSSAKKPYNTKKISFEWESREKYLSYERHLIEAKYYAKKNRS